MLQSGCLLMQLNMIDFFDNTTQSKILGTLLNVSGHSESETDFDKNILPLLPPVCALLSGGVHSE